MSAATDRAAVEAERVRQHGAILTQLQAIPARTTRELGVALATPPGPIGRYLRELQTLGSVNTPNPVSPSRWSRT